MPDTPLPRSGAEPPDAASGVRRFLPWVVACALLMEQLDATIVNTGIPAMAASLGATPLSLKAVTTSYLIALAVGIPVSGWLAERFGTRRIFLGALALFTLSSLACAAAPSAGALVAARVPQGLAAAMMMPVGRMAIVRTFPRGELLRAMNFVIIPALLGPLLGPTVGGLIVHWASWRDMFLVNVPIGAAALVLAWRRMPDYRGDARRPLDVAGLALFGSGAALLSWLLEIFGEHRLSSAQVVPPLALALGLLGGYARHAARTPHPLLRLDLLSIRTLRVSVVGGFVARLGIGGMPLLLPLLYQVGLGQPSWKAGLLMMPAAAAAMGMKALSQRLLARFGFRRVLVANTLAVAATIAAFSGVGPATPVAAIVALSLAMGLVNSLQFSAMNSMAYADVADRDTAQASALASTLQQMSMSFGMACGTLVVAWHLGATPQTDAPAVTAALHHAFLTLAALTLASSLLFRRLRDDDGESVSKGAAAAGRGEAAR